MKISLDGTWQFTSPDKENWLKAQVPGCVQMDLMENGLLPDPYFGLNEQEAYELETKEWLYRREFSVDKIPEGNVDLVCEGLDTVAAVYLNDHLVGKVENMFIPHRFPVREYLCQGNNVIKIHFDSAVRVGETRRQNFGLEYAERSFLRKAQYSFGWDWGPRLLQTGIWRSIYLEAYQARFVHPYMRLKALANNEAIVELETELAGTIPENAEVLAMIKEEGKAVTTASFAVERLGGRLVARGEVKLENPKLWYPSGYGAQPLYQVELTLRAENRPVAETKFSTGLRTVELLQQQDAQGEAFIFAINGIKVFAKGANWIPADSFLPRVSEEDYAHWIQLAKEANMNMLRVWGGGIYEEPAFYETCDRAGIMVWQDFMYACALYPDHLESFRKEAQKEAEEAVLLLRNHPCIVLWCGNNENNLGYHIWWNKKDPTYFGNYLYKQIFPNVVSRLAPDCPYWVSSPWGGEEPNDQNFGDRHNWDVWANWQDYGLYAADKGRFLSEFGFQALPAYKTVLSYTKPEDRKIFSPVTISHNKNEEGTERLVRYLAGRLGLPRDYQSFVYMTQLNQALALKLGVEAWRSRMFDTAGALIWQLNDCRPVSSWALVDYYGRKKAGWWWSRRFFAELLVLLEQKQEGIGLRVVSDCLQMRQGRIRLRAYSLRGQKKGSLEMDITIPANSSTYFATIPYQDLGIELQGEQAPVIVKRGRRGYTMAVEKIPKDLQESVVFVELESQGKTYQNHLVFGRLRDLPLVEPRIEHRVEGCTIVLSANVPAFGVFIETENDVDLSDNCLFLEPNVDYIISASGHPGKVEVFDLTKMRLDL